MKIKLELIVDYDEGDTQYKALANNLSYLVVHAFMEGHLSEGTEATVNDYSYIISEVKE